MRFITGEDQSASDLGLNPIKESYIFAARPMATLISTPLDDNTLSHSWRLNLADGGGKLLLLACGGIVDNPKLLNKLSKL